MTQPLKLRARDSEDLQVISAILQDSIAPISDMTYDAAGKNFVMVVHRLCRDAAMPERLERVCCAINLLGIEKTQLSGIDLTNQALILDLLAVMSGSGTITFIFAGDAKIRLQTGDWSMIIEDFGAPWPAQCNPCHEDTTSTI